MVAHRSPHLYSICVSYQNSVCTLSVSNILNLADRAKTRLEGWHHTRLVQISQCAFSLKCWHMFISIFLFPQIIFRFLHFCNVCVNILVIDQEGLCRWENNTFFVSCEVKRNCSHSILKHFILFASQHLFFLQNKHYQTIPKVFKKRLYWGLVDLVRFEFCMFSGSLIKLVQSLCSFWKAELEFLSNREVSRWIPSVVKFLQAGFKLCIRAGTGYANLPHSFE